MSNPQNRDQDQQSNQKRNDEGRFVGGSQQSGSMSGKKDQPSKPSGSGSR